MAGFGNQPWGGAPWGGGAAAGFDLEGIYARTASTIRLLFTSAPRMLADRDPRDGLTRGSYSLAPLSSGSLVPSPPVPRILAARKIDALELELLLAGELEGSGASYRLEVAPTLENAGGTPIGKRFGAFAGLLTPRTDRGGRALAQRLGSPGLRDLASSPTPKSPAGVLKTTAEGDLDLTEGVETLRKLLYRRLSTRRGEFVWLPEYGFGSVQSAAIGNLLIGQLQAEVRRQVLREPEVASADVAVRHLVGQGVVIVTVNASLRDGLGTASLDVPFAVAGAA